MEQEIDDIIAELKKAKRKYQQTQDQGMMSNHLQHAYQRLKKFLSDLGYND